MSTNNNKKTIKTPSQEAQGHRYELLLSTPVLSGQTPPPPPPRTPRTTTAAAAAGASVTKKKTLRDRKAQRYRRKLRKQRFNQRDIQMHMLRYRQQQQQQQEQIHQEDMEEMSPLNDTMATTNKSANYQTLPGPYNPQRKTNKRKRDSSNQQDKTVVKSLSQMSMTEKKSKKNKRSSSSSCITTSTTTTPQKKQRETEERREYQENIIQPNNIIEQTTSSSSKLHYYLNVPNRKFKLMLRSALVNGQDIIQWCNSEEKLLYIREHTRLLDRVYHLKLEEDLWENYQNYGQTYECWTLPLSKTIIEQNQLTTDYQASQKSMEKYRKKLRQKLQEAEQNVEKHALLLKNYQHKNSLVNEQRLWAAILALVRKCQHKLSQKYEHRKRQFKNSAIDHQLIKLCYDCQPTQEEIRSMQIIWEATINQYKSQEAVDVSKQHIYVKRLPKSLDYLDQSLKKVEKKLSKPVYNNNIRTTFLSCHKKMIAQNKCAMMRFDISMNEAAVRAYHQIAEDEKKNLFNRMIQDPIRQIIANQFKEAIEKRQKHIQQQMQYLTKRRLSFFYHRSDDCQMKWYRRSYRLSMVWDILPSSPIIEIFLKLTSEQLALLARGPKYVPLCQSRFNNKEKIEKMIQQEYQTIMNMITNFFHQHSFCISTKRIEEFFIDLKNLLQRLYTTKLSRKLYIRAKREHKLVMGIRRYLRQYPHVILRRTDKSKVFHLGDANDYQEKVLQYMQETEAYEEITSGISPLATNLQQVTSLLNRLYHTEKPVITKKQYDLMLPKENEIELGHLYFLPKPHKVGTPLRPIVASIHAPATKISTFLDNLLRPIFYKVAKVTSYMNAMQVIKHLEQYQQEGRLLSTTKFIVGDVKNLYTMIPRGGAMDALYRFCTKHAKGGKIGNLTVNTIIRLACLVLDTNCFVFNNKYYKQIRGGAMGSPFTMTLANIYMYEWEQTLIEHQKSHNELFGRYIDDFFMTTNEPIEKIKEFLDNEAKKDPNIGITYTIHDKGEFLDAFIENRQGQLKTSVFRKPAAEPYILPYLSDHPRHIHSNTIYTALLRAIRLCSDVEIFNQERLNIEIALLLNGYPPKFINYHFKRFFRNNNALSIYNDLHTETYEKLHQKLLDESTGNNEKSEQQQQQPPQQQPQQQPQIDNKEKDTKKPKKQKELIIHYRFESGPLLTFNREFRKLWETHFCYEKSPLNNVRLILGTRSNQALDRLLVKKKPSRALLTKMDNTTVATTTTTTTTTI